MSSIGYGTTISMDPRHMIGSVDDGTAPRRAAAAAPDPLAAVADQLAPLLFDRLKAMLRGVHSEAEMIAEAARDTPGLDALSAAALGDWLEERGLGVEAERVRRLPVQDGDLLVITVPDSLSPEGRANVQRSARHIEERLAETGRNVIIMALPESFDLKAVRLACQCSTCQTGRPGG